MSKLSIKKDDTVIVLSGREKGKKGKILHTLPTEGKVVISGVNMVSRHTKPKKQGEEGGIIKKEAPMYASKVMWVCPKCDNPTRVSHVFLADGTKVRKCKKCGETI